MGHKNDPKQMMLMDASGNTRPVSGSFSCELTIFLAKGSVMIAIIVPTPIPTKARPVTPRDHPRKPS